MSFLERFLARHEAEWKRERDSLPVCSKRPNMDQELLADGCARPGYTFWHYKAGGFDKAAVEDWIRERLSLNPMALEYLVEARRYELSIELNGREFELFPIMLTNPPLRLLAENFAVYQLMESGEPFSFAIGEAAGDGDPLLLVVDAETAEPSIRHLETRRVLLRYPMGLEKFLDLAPFSLGVN